MSREKRENECLRDQTRFAMDMHYWGADLIARKNILAVLDKMEESGSKDNGQARK